MLTETNPKPQTGASGVLVVVYDGECPFCRNYVALMALRKATASVDLVDARSDAPPVLELRRLGYDLNEGMAAIYGGNVYHGSDAVIFLSTLANERGWLGRLIALVLREPRRARLLYPIMKLGRRMTLRVLGKRPIAAAMEPSRSDPSSRPSGS